MTRSLGGGPIPKRASRRASLCTRSRSFFFLGMINATNLPRFSTFDARHAVRLPTNPTGNALRPRPRMQGFLGIQKALRVAATSIWIILLVALTLRLGFMWQYRLIHPKQAVSVIPFLFESGNIAHSLATGQGFSSPFRVDTGPTAWMTPAYPLLLAGVFRLFGAYTFGAWAAAVLVNILCCTLACVPIFYAGKRISGVGLGASTAWLGHFP